jgi:hypothetical protein
VIQEFEWAFRFWDLVNAGSMQCELSQENDMVRITLTPDTVIIDILHPSAMDFASPFIDHNLPPKKHTSDHVKQKGLIFGIIGSLTSKKSEISKYLSMGNELASVLHKHEKCLILKEKGRTLAKLGYGVDSLGLRMLNLKYIEVKDLNALMRLVEEAKIEI